MADMRMVIFSVPEAHAEQAVEVLEKHAPGRFWRTDTSDDGVSIYQALMLATRVEPLSDAIEDFLEYEETFMLTVMPINAVMPRRLIAAIEKEEVVEDPGQEETADDGKAPLRVARSEIRSALNKSVTIDRPFIASAAIAAIVASVGLQKGDAAIIIGAMVIAPLLGPHMALALATTLGDTELGKKSLKAAVLGGGLTIGVALIYGLLSPSVLELNPEIANRTEVGFSAVTLAAASGCAGAFAFTSGLSATFVGVMVAVALAPPAVAMCLLAVNRYWMEAGGAGLLFAVNLVGVNLAAVITFRLQGYSPRKWWEKSKAKKAVRVSLYFWCGTLAALIGLVVLLNTTTSGRDAAEPTLPAPLGGSEDQPSDDDAESGVSVDGDDASPPPSDDDEDAPAGSPSAPDA